MTDRIEKQIELNAPVSCVWRALTDHREFGEWFRARIDGPFVVGQEARGQVTYPGYEHLKWIATIKEMVPEKRFALEWHPHAVDPDRDYSDETPTLVVFTLEPTASGGTLLKIVESGFDALPPGRRDEAFRMNDGGWTIQMTQIEAYVESHA